MGEWLIEEPVDRDAVRYSVTMEAGTTPRGRESSAAPGSPAPRPPALAVRLHDIVVHNNRKWFDLVNGADVRVDAIVVTGDVLEDDPMKSYSPGTFRFPDVGDGDRLPADALLVYYGWPRHFIDLHVIVSRDRRDSDDLAALLGRSVGDERFQVAMKGLLGLAGVAVPTAHAVVAGIGAAHMLGDVAYRVVKAVSGSCIGVYRGSKLAYPHRFGRGRNPPEGVFRERFLSLWYEVIDAEPADECSESGATG
jgi:hypothetical protein